MVILTAAPQKLPTQFIMLPNEVFALECRKRYEEQGLVVDKRNGQFAHCPLPKGMGDEGLYLLWGDHQHQGLLQSRDVGRRCFFNGDVKRWLDGFPEGFFELYEIYEEFISGEHHSMYGRTGENHPLFGIPKTEEARRKMSEAARGRTFTEEWKKAQSERVSGENHPMYGRTGENHPFYGRTGALHHNSKAIIAIKPDGTELHFGSCREADRELGINQSQLGKSLKAGKSPNRGRFKGWQFRYV